MTKEELANKYLELMEFKNNMTVNLINMLLVIHEGNLSSEGAEKIIKLANIDSLVNRFKNHVLETFTEEEIEKLVKFSEDPLYKKVISNEYLESLQKLSVDWWINQYSGLNDEVNKILMEERSNKICLN